MWLRGPTVAYQRLDVTAQLLRQAALALDLAQGRYNLGLSNIVKLTQAQLNVTSSVIESQCEIRLSEPIRNPAIHHRSSALTGTPMGRLTPPVLPMTDLRLVQREAELLTKHWRKARQPNERIDKSHQLAR
jgi:hypothetical protein